MDCEEYMRECSDNYFDLAIVDPPYGIKEAAGKNASRNKPFGRRVDSKDTLRTIIKAKDYGNKAWDNEPPSVEYFDELKRVASNYIVFGANHFIDRIGIPSPCWIVWDKKNSGDFADCELAFTTFSSAVRKFEFMWNGMLQGDMKNKEHRIHPTQKPVQLYKWILNKYATTEMRILDTHLGSGSSSIAAHYFGSEFVGLEIDEGYYNAAVDRFRKETTQMAMEF